MIIEVADQLFLGIVRKYYPDTAIVQVEPLFQESADGKTWERIDDREHTFPNRGLVSWLKPSRPPTIGSLWQFRVELQAKFAGDNPKHDRYKTWDRSAPVLAREVIDFGVITEPELRRRLLEFSLGLDYDPCNPTYFKIAGEYWYGPVNFKYEEGKGGWVLDVSQPVPLAAPLLREALTRIDLMEDGGRRYFFGPSTKAPNGIGQVDWAPDAEIVKRVLKALGKFNKDYVEQLNLTEKSVELAVQELLPNGDGTNGAALLKYRTERAQQIVKQVRFQHDLLKQFESDLVLLPAVKELLAKYEREERQRLEDALAAEYARQETERLSALEKEIAALKTVAASELAKQTQSAQQKLQKLEEQAAQAQRRCDELAARSSSLKQEITEQEEKLHIQVDAFETALLERLEKLIKSPQDILADIAIFRAALGVVQAPAKSSPEPAQAPTATAHGTYHASLGVQAPEGQPVSDLHSCAKAVRHSFRQSGLSYKPAAALHAVLQAGAVPLLWGADSYAVLQAYADAVLGGCAHWIPVSATTVQWSDLFGSYDSAARRFIPAANGLADLVVAAQLAPEQMHMAVLDGVNRAAVEMYLEPLLACYSDAQSGRSGRRLSAVHPSCLEFSDPYRLVAGFQWPRNLLLAGVLSEGAALPLPSNVWRYAAWVDAGSCDASTEESGRTLKAAPVNNYIRASVWQEWRTEAQQTGDGALRSLLDSLTASGVVLSRAERQIDQATYDAARLWFGGQDDPRKASLALAAVSCIAPQLVPHVQSAGAESLYAALQQQDIDPEPMLAALEMLEKING